MDAVTLFGVVGLAFTMVMYGLEDRHALYTVGFAAGCAMASAYGFLAGTWPFGVVEAMWVAVALRRYLQRVRAPPRAPQGPAGA